MPRFLPILLLLKLSPLLAVPIGHEPTAEPRGSSAMGALSAIACIDGQAGDFPCNGVDLLAYVPLEDMGCGSDGEGLGNDIWGWTDSVTGTEYALMGCHNGTSFIDLSDPKAPVFIGRLPTHTDNSIWRDIKVYADHAYIVSEATGHGLQVFDLTQLRDVSKPPVVFENTAHLDSFSTAHNIAINEETGFAYVVGSDHCNGGLYFVDINEPASPVFAGCFDQDGYTHDTQCVIYRGPDTRYQGREICFNSNIDTLTIVDVTDKLVPALTENQINDAVAYTHQGWLTEDRQYFSGPVLLGRQTYDDAAYTHQGWLTEDHQYFLLGDEHDELNENNDIDHTRTIIWDVSDLEAPLVIGFYFSTETAIDHNLYILGNYVYQANYTAGLRILDLAEVAAGELTEVAYFDVSPEQETSMKDDATMQNDAGPRHDDEDLSFSGAWSNFPFFDSGIVIVSSIGSAGEPGGLFVLQPHITVHGRGLIFHDRFE